MKTPTIETERLTLRVTTREEMTAAIAAAPCDELKQAYAEMLQCAEQSPELWRWFAMWAIELKDGTHVGDFSFKGLNPDGSVEIGYGIDDEFQGNGYATEAVGAATRWAASEPGVTRVEAETEPDNRASQRVLVKCGFVPTGAMGEEGPRCVSRGR